MNRYWFSSLCRSGSCFLLMICPRRGEEALWVNLQYWALFLGHLRVMLAHKWQILTHSELYSLPWALALWDPESGRSIIPFSLQCSPYSTEIPSPSWGRWAQTAQSLKMPWPLRSWVNNSSALHMGRHLLSVSIPGRVLEFCWSCESGQLKYSMRKVLRCWLHCKQSSKQYFYKYFICINTAQGQQHREHLLWSSSASEIRSDSKFWKEDNDDHGRGWGACVLFLD